MSNVNNIYPEEWLDFTGSEIGGKGNRGENIICDPVSGHVMNGVDNHMPVKLKSFVSSMEGNGKNGNASNNINNYNSNENYYISSKNYINNNSYNSNNNNYNSNNNNYNSNNNNYNSNHKGIKNRNGDKTNDLNYSLTGKADRCQKTKMPSSATYKNNNNNYDLHYVKVRKDNNLVNKINKSEYRNNFLTNIKKDRRKGCNDEIKKCDYRNLQNNIRVSSNVNIDLKKTNKIKGNRNLIEKGEICNLNQEDEEESLQEKEEVNSKRVNRGKANYSKVNNSLERDVKDSSASGKYLLELIKGTNKLELTKENILEKNCNSTMQEIMLSNNVKCFNENALLCKYYNKNNSKISTCQEMLKYKENSYNDVQKCTNHNGDISSHNNLKIEKNNIRNNVNNEYNYNNSGKDNKKSQNFNEMAIMEKLSKHLNSYNPYE
nr:mRNA-decapping enzyme 2,putative [Plasmodium sp. DRC-Itaito]